MYWRRKPTAEKTYPGFRMIEYKLILSCKGRKLKLTKLRVVLLVEDCVIQLNACLKTCYRFLLYEPPFWVSSGHSLSTFSFRSNCICLITTIRHDSWRKKRNPYASGTLHILLGPLGLKARPRSAPAHVLSFVATARRNQTNVIVPHLRQRVDKDTNWCYHACIYTYRPTSVRAFFMGLSALRLPELPPNCPLQAPRLLAVFLHEVSDRGAYFAEVLLFWNEAIVTLDKNVNPLNSPKRPLISTGVMAAHTAHHVNTASSPSRYQLAIRDMLRLWLWQALVNCVETRTAWSLRGSKTRLKIQAIVPKRNVFVSCWCFLFSKLLDIDPHRRLLLARTIANRWGSVDNSKNVCTLVTDAVSYIKNKYSSQQAKPSLSFRNRLKIAVCRLQMSLSCARLQANTVQKQHGDGYIAAMRCPPNRPFSIVWRRDDLIRSTLLRSCYRGDRNILYATGTCIPPYGWMTRSPGMSCPSTVYGDRFVNEWIQNER